MASETPPRRSHLARCQPNDVNCWRERMVGLDERLPLLNAGWRRTSSRQRRQPPPFRGSSTRSSASYPITRACTAAPGSIAADHAAYDEAHDTIAHFVGADTSTNTVIFGKNTTEAINRLAFRYPLTPQSVVVSTVMEHHSNDLPGAAAPRSCAPASHLTGGSTQDDLTGCWRRTADASHY